VTLLTDRAAVVGGGWTWQLEGSGEGLIPTLQSTKTLVSELPETPLVRIRRPIVVDRAGVTGAGRPGSGIAKCDSRLIEVRAGDGKSEPDEGWGGLLRLRFFDLGAEESRDQGSDGFGVFEMRPMTGSRHDLQTRTDQGALEILSLTRRGHGVVGTPYDQGWSRDCAQ